MASSLPNHTRRMAELVNRPGGLTAREAVRSAELRLETIRDSSLKELVAMVEDMITMGEELSRVRSVATSQKLYATSNSIVGVAGVFGVPELGEVALSLCTLLDRQSVTGSWHREAVELHLNSLRLMCHGGETNLNRSVIQALHQVVARIPHGNRANG